MTSFEHAVAATRGAREYQEDTAAFWPGGEAPFMSAGVRTAAPVTDGIAVLADGMGGHAGGALASRMACEAFLESIAGDRRSAYDRLQTALRAANAAIAGKVADNPLLSGMGSTLIGAAFSNDGIEWISVGDSPLYLYRRGEVAMLNEDHSLAPELDRLVAAGRLTEDEARRDPRRHMLRSAVTGDEIDMIDFSKRPLALEAGDYVILASDGLDTLETQELARLIQGYGADGAEAVAKAIIRAVEALREPYQDNATVLVVRPLL
ncbi:MAG: protein phosphatase 2C domain-containing protein [Hyphomicrobium sp.]